MREFFGLKVAQDATVAAREAQRENTARWAVSQHTIATQGLVTIRFVDPLLFEAPFTASPFVSTGLAIQEDFDPDSGWVPRVAAGVHRWHRNDKGHYIGAFVFVQVESGVFDARLLHHFTFSGVAYKPVSQEATNQAQMLAARAVGYGKVV